MNKLILVVALFISLFGCKNAEREENNRRRAVMQEWISAAEMVANQTQDEEALKIVGQIKKSCVLAKPMVEKDGSFSIVAVDEMPTATHRIALMPMLASDYQEEWAKQLNKTNDSYGCYNSLSKNLGVIRLKSAARISVTQKGIVLLHEGKHWLNDIDGDLDDLDVKYPQVAKAIDEYRTFEFESRLTRKLGGNKYVQLLQRSSVLLQDKLRRNEDVEIELPWFSDQLQEIFGKAATEEELLLEQQELWVMSLMTAYDSIYGHDTKRANVLKGKFFAQFYQP